LSSDTPQHQTLVSREIFSLRLVQILYLAIPAGLPRPLFFVQLHLTLSKHTKKLLFVFFEVQISDVVSEGNNERQLRLSELKGNCGSKFGNKIPALKFSAKNLFS